MASLVNGGLSERRGSSPTRTSKTAGEMGMRRNSHSGINLVAAGVEGTLEYRLNHVMDEHDTKVISAWHDIPLYVLNEDTGKATGQLNFVCEIPRCSRKKFEIATQEPGNPIKQDEKKGVLREFKKGDIFFNYGCFPRTWEDPEHIHPDTGHAGDNDPLDVCEIGMRIVPTGDVRQVKVLGVLAMIDDGETDWKVICIDSEDRWAPELNDVADVERLLPGVIDSVREWFRTYKIPDGKEPNVFALDERCMPRPYAMKVVNECHLAWRRLINKASAGGAVPRNLSVSKLSELASELEPESILQLDEGATVDAAGADAVGEGEEDDEEDGDEGAMSMDDHLDAYPASLIA